MIRLVFLDKKKMIYPQILWDLGNCIDQNTLNLSKTVLSEVLFNENEWYEMYRTVKVSIQPI